MAERVTKSYADKIAELNNRIEEMTEKAQAYYSQAGDLLFNVLDVTELEDLIERWNSLAPKKMKVDEIECEAKMPTIDPTLARKNPKKFAELVKECQEVTDAQNVAAGEAISNILHVSVLGDLRAKLRDLGILNDGAKEVVKESKEETLEEVFAKEQAEQKAEETDNSSYFPYV